MTVKKNSNTAIRSLTFLLLTIALSACSGNSPSQDDADKTALGSKSVDTESKGLIKVNQIGYLPSMSKLAIVPDSEADTFFILDAQTETIAYSGK